jgi:hypothetical protein
MDNSSQTPGRQIVFDADDYLRRHFTGPLAENNTVLMRFHASLYQQIRPKSLLEFGGGPTIYAIISTVQSVESIHFVDYSPSCRAALQKWKLNLPGAFDWKPYIRYSLEAETGSCPTDDAVIKREALLRERIRMISECDAWARDPLQGTSYAPYDAIASNFCLEGITNEKAKWLWLNENITRGFEKGTYYIITCLWGVTSYVHDGATHSSLRLEPEDLEALYSQLNYKLLRLEKVKLQPDYGYLMACGQKM